MKETPREDEGRYWGDTEAKECRKLPLEEVRERPGANSPSEPQREPALILDY